MYGPLTIQGYFKIRKLMDNTSPMIPFISKRAETEVKYIQRERRLKRYIHIKLHSVFYIEIHFVSVSVSSTR